MNPGTAAQNGRAQTEATIRRAAPHLQDRDVIDLAEIVDRLVRTYEPEKIYLFGSKARGDDGPDSDFDLLVLVPDTYSQDRKRSALGFAALRGTGIAADVVVWPRSDFESRRHVVASLPATVLREGRLLHAA
jgi:predicted nucleotidyltransferase